MYANTQRPLADVMHMDYLLAYGLGSAVMMLAGYLWARYVNHSTGSYRAFFAMGTSCSNSGYMGYPVAQLVLGSIAPVALALNMVFENLIKLPVLLTLADNADPVTSGGTLSYTATVTPSAASATVVSRTPKRSANWRWVNPAALRAASSRSPKVATSSLNHFSVGKFAISPLSL